MDLRKLTNWWRRESPPPPPSSTPPEPSPAPEVRFRDLPDFRRRVLLKHITLPCDALEIGAFAMPTLTPQETRLKILDFYPTEDLRAQAAKNGVDPARVIPVDYVCRDDRYDGVVQEQFDVVIANHVFEHVDNPIEWLQRVRRLLRAGAVLFLVMPDKKFSFDKFRSDTPLAHLLYDHLVPGRNLKEVHALETELHYDLTYIKQENRLATKLDLERLRRSLTQLHPGIHTHVFQFETFAAGILKPLVYLRVIDFEFREIVNCRQFGEFAVVLRAGHRPPDLRPEEFFKPAADTQR
jgi:SAM-dependent methyltransferase